MYNNRNIKDFTQNIAQFFGLSEEHGYGLYQMMINSHKGSSGLYFSTNHWRTVMNEKYNWITDKPTTRILNDLEQAELISRRERFSYDLNKHVFGVDYWHFISGINMIVNYNDDGREIVITRKYSRWNEDDEIEVEVAEERSVIRESRNNTNNQN